MDAHFTSSTRCRSNAFDVPLAQIAKQALLPISIVTLVLSVAVVTRGMLGALKAPDAGWFLVVVVVIAELLASAFRVIWPHLYPGATRNSLLAMRLGFPSFCVLCLAIALSTTNASGWAIGSFWLVVVGSEIAWWYPGSRRMRGDDAEPVEAVVTSNQSPIAVEEEFEEEETLDTSVVQRVTRSRNEVGVEVLSGLLRAEFVADERTHNLHVAFCPPLAYEPRVTAYQLEGPPLAIKIAQSEIYGVRIELRLAEAAAPSESATICFEVQPIKQRVPT